jgi:hypothetical protein
MSEVKLNLTDGRQTLSGNVHGATAERLVASLTAEPETIAELLTALERFEKIDPDEFEHLQRRSDIDEVPWDAGILVIDLAARIVASESTYSYFGPSGSVEYHNRQHATDVRVSYRLSEDWLFIDSIDEYNAVYQERRDQRALNPPLDMRAVLFGKPLLEWLVLTVTERIASLAPVIKDFREHCAGEKCDQTEGDERDSRCSELYKQISNELVSIHSTWLMTPRADLRGMTPREVLLEKQEFIDSDLESRCAQWSLQGEGPPCIPVDSDAYRFAGFGIHEWVIYYDLVRYLLWSIVQHPEFGSDGYLTETKLEAEIARLEELKTEWLEQPQEAFSNRTPAVLIDNERRRLPIALTAQEMIIDEDCPACQMLAQDTLEGGPGFWHLDGSHMEDEFAFSWVRTPAEWEQELIRRKEFDERFEREWLQRRQNSQGEDGVEGVEADSLAQNARIT